ncbi:MAG: hypothetical protein MUF54_08280 [Polyangiaceae bacterium]|nr:hypothetical protein [Polyangiaceae bacterium]
MTTPGTTPLSMMDAMADAMMRADAAERAVALARDMIARLETENAELARRCAVLAEIESVLARGGR